MSKIVYENEQALVLGENEEAVTLAFNAQRQLLDEHPEWAKLHWTLVYEQYKDGRAYIRLRVIDKNAVSWHLIIWVAVTVVIIALMYFAPPY
jgi:hypothetical protein